MISERDFEKVCHLAKLSIPEDDRSRFLDKLNSVFNWIDQLTQIDTSCISEELSSQLNTTPERSDISGQQNSKNEILSNTKDKKFGMFCVPKIVE